METTDPHPYSDRRSFERLMLLMAAIAHNPGIGSTRQAKEAGVDPMLLLLEAMQEIAAEQGKEPFAWAPATLRKDIKLLKAYGLLPSDSRCTAGYVLGAERSHLPPRTVAHKGEKALPEILRLRAEGLSYQQIADRVELSKAAIGKILRGVGTTGQDA